MRLGDETLAGLEKPGRYVGGEVNEVRKDPGGLLRFAFCFPDVYEIGMSNLGLQIMYFYLNRRRDTWCERAFMPWPDMAGLMGGGGPPLFALESRDPLAEFDFLGFSLQVELCYTNALAMLDLAGLPLRREDRDGRHPLVFAGGACAFNPEPMSDFFDFFYIGDGEAAIDGVLDAYRACGGRGGGRAEFLRAICGLPGIYVPSLYRAEYGPDGALAAFAPLGGAPARVPRAFAAGLDYYPDRLLAPLVEATQNRTALEIARGCGRGCRFCQAGFVSRPVRERAPGKLAAMADGLLASTGHSEISLLALSACDHSGFAELLGAVAGVAERRRAGVSLPSTRLDALAGLSRIRSARSRSLTVAPEAGSQRMRDAINKNLTREDITEGCRRAFEEGYDRMKLYFMSGLPFETEADTAEIAALCDAIVDEYYRLPAERRRRAVEVGVSTACFVPKPFTPFQWARQAAPEEFERSQRALKSGLRNRRVSYRYHDARAAQVEGVLARGDRRLGRAVEAAYAAGAVFDGWSEHFRHDIWTEAFAECGLSPDFYAHRERPPGELLPWDFIDGGVSRGFLLSEWEKAAAGALTPGCAESCAGCGACRDE